MWVVLVSRTLRSASVRVHNQSYHELTLQAVLLALALLCSLASLAQLFSELLNQELHMLETAF